MTDLKINVCSLGNPLSPKTWSGTVFKISEELKKKNVFGLALETDLFSKSILRKIIRRAGIIYYNNSKDIERGYPERYLKSKYVQNFFNKNKKTNILHFGTMDLPFINPKIKINHFLFCDSTWNLWSNFSTQKSEYKTRLIKDAEILEKKSYEQVKHIFTISQYVKRNIIEHYNIPESKITVVGTGRGSIKPYYDDKDYKNGLILFVAKGRFSDKGGNLLIEAFNNALKSNPNLKLVIIGDKNYKEIVGEQKNISVYGYVEQEQLQNFFNEATLFVMPAINEPWGLVYLEALSCKIPVVGLNRNSIPEITQYGKFGYCINEPDPMEISNIILKAYNNPLELQKMGEEGQKYCLANYNWENTASNIIEIISNYK
jgi:glycosyltransferase involved in cell wall biosynthesis